LERIIVTFFRQLVLASALCSAAPAAAQGFEDLDALQGRIVAALGAGIGEPGGPSSPLDRRMKLAACPELAVLEAPVMGAATIRCEPLGWRIRVPLVRSAFAQPGVAAKAAPAIRKGDQVEVRAGGSDFQISMTAIAEEDGSPGDRIRVRSDRNQPVIIAQVDGPGMVFLPGFK
jgi:flagellar basal body P-ring formation protein FlgA